MLSRRWRELRLRRVQRRLAGPRLLQAFAEAYPEALFIEIGANDGEQHDHLYPLIVSHPWRGIMVEPVPFVFERLKRNYGGRERIALENIAIGARDGRVPFYHLAEARGAERERLPDWYDGIGSFSRSAVLGHARDIPDIERRLVCTEVPCLTFRSLCARHDIDRLDLLLIDTEGHDHEILEGIDLDVHRPRLIVYEHYHLAAQAREQCRARLTAQGYEVMEEGFDTWCLRTPPADRLSETWRGLRPGVPGVSALDGRR